MPTVIPPLVAFAVCYILLAWLLRQEHYLPLDHPNERSLHVHPVPRVGGLGIVAGMSLAMLLFQPVLSALLLALALALAALSWLDDLRGLSVQMRLLSHLLAAGVFLSLAGGVGMAGLILALLAMVWMTNLYNFMDGADGLAGGMAVVGFGGYGLAAWMAGATELAVVSLSVAAASLAFLRFNIPTAQLFMGDSGSIPLGFLAAGLGWLGCRDGLWPPLFPILLFSPFIVDATVTLFARLRRGDKVWQAHRSHYYQRLVRMGLNHGRLALGEYAVMVAAMVSGLMLVVWPELQWGLIMFWMVFYGVVMLQIDKYWRESGHAH